jgi:8-oxo-dGTP pyrophosphatase MutT (NUDIX family)
MDEKSCGVVLFTETEDGARKYALVRSAVHNHWGLPKGHVENNETERETALREVREETGVADAEILDGFRKQIEYRMPNGIKKQVVFFCAKYKNQELQGDPSEINSLLALPVDEAAKLLSHDDVKGVLLNADEWISALI